MKLKATVSILVLAGLFACGKPPKHNVGVARSGEQGVGSDDLEGGKGGKPGMLTCTNSGRTYKGFGNVELTAARLTEIPMEGDRFRIKPFDALKSDFQRVMGSVPKSLDANAATFAAAPERWYSEPVASAVTLFTTYRVSYEAALTFTGSDAKYASAPTQDSAKAACDSFARQVWNKVPTSEQVASCVKIAVVDTAAESDPKSRWAYALASVLSATGFVAY